MAKIKRPLHDNIAFGLDSVEAAKRLKFYNSVVLPLWDKHNSKAANFAADIKSRCPQRFIQLKSRVHRGLLTPKSIFSTLFPHPHCVCGVAIQNSTPQILFCSENCSRYHRSRDDYISRLSKKFGNGTRMIGEFKGLKCQTLHKCGGCNENFKTSPRHLLLRSRLGVCPECTKLAQSRSNRLSAQQFKKRFSAAHAGRCKLLSSYEGLSGTVKIQCVEHQLIFSCSGKTALMPYACPECLRSRQSQNALKRVRSRAKYRLKTVCIEGRTIQCQGYEPQAIRWLLANVKDLKVNDLRVDHEDTVPTFKYKLGRRTRTYFPDLYVEKKNLIVEVKSNYTLGLLNGKGWYKNQLKAQAVKRDGYKFFVLLMDHKGKCIGQLPTGWEKMSRKEVLIRLAWARADVLPDDSPVKKFTPY